MTSRTLQLAVTLAVIVMVVRWMLMVMMMMHMAWMAGTVGVWHCGGLSHSLIGHGVVVAAQCSKISLRRKGYMCYNIVVVA